MPYTHPGSADVRPLVLAKARDHAAVLLANHGPVVSGRSFRDAIFAAEELEETAKLVFLTQGRLVRRLDAHIVAELEQRPLGLELLSCFNPALTLRVGDDHAGIDRKAFAAD